jgi:hypothetical protein
MLRQQLVNAAREGQRQSNQLRAVQEQLTAARAESARFAAQVDNLILIQATLAQQPRTDNTPRTIGVPTPTPLPPSPRARPVHASAEEMELKHTLQRNTPSAYNGEPDLEKFTTFWKEVEYYVRLGGGSGSSPSEPCMHIA